MRLVELGIYGAIECVMEIGVSGQAYKQRCQRQISMGNGKEKVEVMMGWVIES